MHQYNVGAPFERITMDNTGLFSESERGNPYPIIAMNFKKWPEDYAIPN
jgi:hypothetical protein